MALQPFDSVTRGAIVQLKKLKPKLEAASPEARIEFVSTVFEFDLYHEIISHQLIERYGLSGRDYYDCFEMNDGEFVVHGLMAKAISNPVMEANIRATGERVWDNWMATYHEHKPQGALFE